MKKFHSKKGEIAYLVKGKGSPTFFLIHNSGGSHEMMHHTADFFATLGKVIVPDLLGHGESDKPSIEYTIPLFAETCLELCQLEQLGPTVLIGLNYGADIAIEMARLAPLRFTHLILIEPPLLMESWVVKMVEKQIEDLKDPKEDWAEEMVNSVIEKASKRDREIALSALKMTPPSVKASTFTHLLKWDRSHSKGCSTPTLLIQTSQPFCEEEQAGTLFSNLHVSRVAKSGPWATLEVSSQLESMIVRFLECSRAG